MRKRVGEFVLLNTIGQGACGRVKLAYNERTGDEFAVKVLKKWDMKDRLLTENVRKEIAVMNMLDHPSIVRLHQVLTTRQHIYIVMELVTGGDLYDEIMGSDSMGLEEWEAQRYFRQLIAGVEHCHSRGVYHRDLKPENILLDEHGRLKITDFGFSTLKQQYGSQSDVLHTQCGTPNYVPPEIISPPADGYSGAKVDVWSCGVILYMMVAGRMPFEDEDIQQLFRKITTGSVEYPEWFSPQLVDILSGMFRTERGARFTLDEVRRHAWFRQDVQRSANNGARLACAPSDGAAATAVQVPVLAKTESVRLQVGQELADAFSDGTSDGNPSNFSDYTLDLSVSDMGTITLRDRVQNPETQHAPQERGPTAVAPNPKNSVRLPKKAAGGTTVSMSADQATKAAPVRRTRSVAVARVPPSSSSESEPDAKAAEPLADQRSVPVRCVGCGRVVEQLPSAEQLQHICRRCCLRRTASQRMTAQREPPGSGELRGDPVDPSKFASLDEHVFRDVLERERRDPAEGGALPGDPFDLTSDCSFHIAEEWEAECLEELEEHGLNLGALNEAWARGLGQPASLPQSVPQVSPRGASGDGGTKIGFTALGANGSTSGPLAPRMASEGATRHPGGRWRAGYMLEDPSQPWMSPAAPEEVPPGADGQRRQVLRDPFVSSDLSAPNIKERKSVGSSASDPLLESRRDASLQDPSFSGEMDLVVVNRAPLAAGGSAVPRLFEGLRTLKRQGQQRRVFDSLCTPATLALVLKQILDEMGCEAQVKESRGDVFKILATLRPPSVKVVMSTKIEMYRKTDALSKVSLRKTRGSRQDFVSFFSTLRDKYAQAAHTLR